MKRFAILLISLSFIIISNAVPADAGEDNDVSGIVERLWIDQHDKGSMFYVRVSNVWIVFDRERVGSLSYDQFFALFLKATSNRLRVYIAAERYEEGDLPMMEHLEKIVSHRAFAAVLFGKGS